ncbi:TusE/DsrC/DsvC family sulfur relay protein [Amphritea sp. HPY]|uniref:TusE/DsrC/DsvC family sulfur relay protein n=1 Tax=Amphritea sp. HPY TaxID=3421652 RepID=UPI003D7DBA0D
MTEIMIDGQLIPQDSEGYLREMTDWTPAIAEQIALQEGIALTDAHWEILNVLRAFYQKFELSPAMRPLVKAVANELGPDKGKSIYLMSLFPGSPAKLTSKIAGLPKPTNCL